MTAVGGVSVDGIRSWRAANDAVSALYPGGVRRLTNGRGAGRSRGGTTGDVWPRKLALYVAVVGLDVGVRPISRASGLARSTVATLIRDVEDRRASPLIDGVLELLAADARRRLAGDWVSGDPA